VNRWCLSNISRLVLLVEVTDSQRGILKNKKNKILLSCVCWLHYLVSPNNISYQLSVSDCPWGDAPNAGGCNQINNLTSGFYCTRHHIASPNFRLINQVTGMNCCGSCMETTQRTAPHKSDTWRNQYPGLYWWNWYYWNCCILTVFTFLFKFWYSRIYFKKYWL
jgi:hypothetical protein